MKVIFSIALLLSGTIGDCSRQSSDQQTATTTTKPATTAATARQLTATDLQPTPRARFTPTTRKGYWNIDVVSDFTLPATKSITFCGAGRNLHVGQDWSKLFRRGFSAIEQSRMTNDERWQDGNPPNGWHSRLAFNQRTLVVWGQYFGDDPFSLAWARNGDMAPMTWYKRPDNDPAQRNSVYQAAFELAGGCVGFGDCPGKLQSTYGLIMVDVENDANTANRQEHANLTDLILKTIKDNADPRTKVGAIWPVAHNSFGYSRSSDYRGGTEWLWDMPVHHTANSRQRGMPDALVGKSFADLIDFQMPGTYYVYPDFDYTISHTGDGDRHWLAALVGEQEVNAKLSPKKRIAWQWLFNTQSSEFPNSSKAEHATPPAIAEGMGIFYWFTGAYGSILFDDIRDLSPDQPSPTDPNMRGLGNDRIYACYEHYIHGLWRLFKHHGDLFNGREKYLNDQTECSFDGGQTWVKYNANQLKTRNLPFVRAIVNGNQILVAATKPYAKSGQISQVKLRYTADGYNFVTDISLQGDEIFLGRAAMQ